MVTKTHFWTTWITLEIKWQTGLTSLPILYQIIQKDNLLTIKKIKTFRQLIKVILVILNKIKISLINKIFTLISKIHNNLIFKIKADKTIDLDNEINIKVTKIKVLQIIIIIIGLKLATYNLLTISKKPKIYIIKTTQLNQNQKMKFWKRKEINYFLIDSLTLQYLYTNRL